MLLQAWEGRQATRDFYASVCSSVDKQQNKLKQVVEKIACRWYTKGGDAKRDYNAIFCRLIMLHFDAGLQLPRKYPSSLATKIRLIVLI